MLWEHDKYNTLNMKKQIFYKEVDGITIPYQELTQWWVLRSMSGITVNGKIYFRDAHKPKSDRVLRHEYIHVLQQDELGFYKFLLLYCWQWVIGLIKFQKAYLNIKFEREAYANQKNIGYLKRRKPFNWKNYGIKS